MWQGRMCHLPAVAFGLIHSCGSSLGKGDPREGAGGQIGEKHHSVSHHCGFMGTLWHSFLYSRARCSPLLLPQGKSEMRSPCLLSIMRKQANGGGGVRSATETVRDLSGPDPSVCQMIAEMDCNERRRESCSVCPCM